MSNFEKHIKGAAMTHPYIHQEKEKIRLEINQYLLHHSIETKSKDIRNIIEIMYRTLEFNKSLKWDKNVKSVSLVTTAKDLIEIYQLRSKIYKEMHYDREFPDPIEGLNFDLYDVHSAIVYSKSKEGITGTCRIIFDSTENLPLDKNFSLDYLRAKGKKLAELSRLIIDRQTKSLSQEPRLLTLGAYTVMKKNAMTTLVSVMVEEHYKFYQKFGGFSVEERLQTYGSLETPFIITSWEIAEISNFFKKLFLSL